MRYRLADLVVESAEALPDLDIIDAPADVAVHWFSDVPPDRARWFHAWPSQDGGDWVRFGRSDRAFLLEFPGHARFSVSDDGSSVYASALGVTPLTTVRHLLCNQVLPLVLSRRGRLVLHASAVSVDDHVVAFAGPSDSGKSTLAAACSASGARHVADDALVVTPAPAGSCWLAMAMFSGLRLWPSSAALLGWSSNGAPVSHYSPKVRYEPDAVPIPFESRRLPLSRVIVLASSRGGPPRIEELSGHRAALSIATHLFRLDPDDTQETVRLFDAISRVTQVIRVSRFETDHPVEDGRTLLPELLRASQDFLLP